MDEMNADENTVDEDDDFVEVKKRSRDNDATGSLDNTGLISSKLEKQQDCKNPAQTQSKRQKREDAGHEFAMAVDSEDAEDWPQGSTNSTPGKVDSGEGGTAATGRVCGTRDRGGDGAERDDGLDVAVAPTEASRPREEQGDSGDEIPAPPMRDDDAACPGSEAMDEGSDEEEADKALRTLQHDKEATNDFRPKELRMLPPVSVPPSTARARAFLRYW